MSEKYHTQFKVLLQGVWNKNLLLINSWSSWLFCSWIFAPWCVINSIIETIIIIIKLCDEGVKITESIRLLGNILESMSTNYPVCCLKFKTVEISHYVRALPCHYQTQNSLIHFTALHAVFQLSICRENCIPTAVVSHQSIRQCFPYARTAGLMGNLSGWQQEFWVTFQCHDHALNAMLQAIMFKYSTSLVEPFQGTCLWTPERTTA